MGTVNVNKPPLRRRVEQDIAIMSVLQRLRIGISWEVSKLRLDCPDEPAVKLRADNLEIIAKGLQELITALAYVN